MEFFAKAKAVKLRSHLEKYLVADDDQETVRQSRNSAGKRGRWFVELVQDKPNVIRLRSCHGKYLTATDLPFLLGMTGKKVSQTVPDDMDWRLQWEPIRDGFQVKLKTWCGKFLRANGGTPPWRNSITHDEPHTGATQRWILWDVEAVRVPESESIMEYFSSVSSFSSVSDEVLEVLSDDVLGSSPQSPTSVVSSVKTPRVSIVATGLPKLLAKQVNSNKYRTGINLFHNAKAVRLRSHHDKYLLAEDDEESVTQDRNGSSKNARWTVEFVPGSEHLIRLKSCCNKYLTASDEAYLLGMTGRKVIQTLPKRLDSSVEWEPIRDGSKLKFKTRYGNFLRANGWLPPWRNSVTHDIPHRTVTQDWILWDVDIVEIQDNSHGSAQRPSSPHADSLDFESTTSPSSVSTKSGHLSEHESRESSSPKTEGRTIYYHVADEGGKVDDEAVEGYSFSFKGNGVHELTEKLKEVTGLEDVVVCTRSPLNGKLFPLRLQLPPNNADMHVVVVPLGSKGE